MDFYAPSVQLVIEVDGSQHLEPEHQRRDSLRDERLKEIGLRKTMGGKRGEIIRQFLVENILVSSISAGFGLLLAYYIFLPGFNSGFPMEIPFEFSSNLALLSFFGGLLLFISLVSGAYPAFYISSFKPGKRLKNCPPLSQTNKGQF